MPFTTPAAFKTALLNGTVRASIAIRIVRGDGVVFGFTNAQADVTLPALTVGAQTVPQTTYRAGIGMVPSNLQESDDLTPNNMEISGILGDYLTEADVRKKRFKDAAYTLIVFNRADTTHQILRGRGRIGDASVAGHQATFKLRSLASLLQNDIIELTSSVSRAAWGDPEMAFFNLDSDYTAIGSLARVTGNVNLVANSRRIFTLPVTVAYPATWMNEGTVEWISGANAGVVMDVMSSNSANGQITLWHPTPYDIAIGDSVRATIRAPLTIEEWVATFGNGRYFAGEPGIMTSEQMYQVKADDEDAEVD